MKSSIIFFALFALIVSKKEFKSFIENVNDIINGENFMCNETETDEQKCLATPLPITQIECCHLSAFIGEYHASSVCEPIPTALQIVNSLQTLPVFKAAEKETLGFVKYNHLQPIEEEESDPITVKVKCSHDEITFKEEKYTNEEKQVLTNENHCLNLFMNTVDHLDVTQKCEDGLLLESSKKAGLECGYVSFSVKFKYVDFQLDELKTCFLFDINVYDKIVHSELGDGLKKLLKESINQIIGQYCPTQYQTFIDSFSVDFYDTKGNRVSYNSTIDDYEVKPIKPIDPEDSNGSFITISKYLLLFALILF